MATDRKPHGLYCQKCRTPIDIDASIDQLNPAAFKLLTGMPLTSFRLCTLQLTPG
jgi:beclin 1